MVVLKVLAIIILIFFLIGMIKVGISFSFVNDQLSLGLIVLGKKISLDKKLKEKKVPKEPKPEKPKKEKKEKPVKEKNKKEKPVTLSLTFDDILKIIKYTFKSISKVNKGFNFDKFLLHITVSTDDPYNSAILFGDINALLCALEPICSKRFNCKDLDVWTDINFNEVIPRVDLAFDLTVRIHSFTRRIDIIFYAARIFIAAKTRGLILKITDREEYEYQIELKTERKEKLKVMMNKVKSSKTPENDKSIEQIINTTQNNSDINERTIS